MEQDLATVIDQGDTEALFRLLTGPEQQIQATCDSNMKESTTDDVQFNKETLEDKVEIETRERFPWLDVQDIHCIYEACNQDRDLAETVVESLANSEAMKQNSAEWELDTESYSKALEDWSHNFPSLQKAVGKEQQVEEPVTGKDASNSHSNVYSLQKLATLFPNLEKTSIARCFKSNQCRFKETFSELVKKSVDSCSEPVVVHTIPPSTKDNKKLRASFL